MLANCFRLKSEIFCICFLFVTEKKIKTKEAVIFFTIKIFLKRFKQVFFLYKSYIYIGKKIKKLTPRILTTTQKMNNLHII